MSRDNERNGEWHGIWVIADQMCGALNAVSFELLGKAQELKKASHMDEPVNAILLGEGVKELAPILAGYGAENVIVADHPALRLFQNDIYASVLEEMVADLKPSVIFIGATATGSDLAPTLGARLKTGVAAHCVDARFEGDGNLVAVVPAFGGKVLGDISCPEHRPQIASFKPGVFTKNAFCENTEFKLVEYNPAALANGCGRVKALEYVKGEAYSKPLEEAEIIITGGWGMGSRDNWKLLEELAEVLSGAVGCTRPVVDEGWAQENQMIGTSGKTVRPKIYLGAAISGAAHHTCGMKDADLVISINSDEKASIFEVSDLSVVGDAKIILSLLLEEIRKVS